MKADMKPDTETWAERNPARWEVYFRRASAREQWEISECYSPPFIGRDNGIAILVQSPLSHPILRQKFDSPDDAVQQLLPILKTAATALPQIPESYRFQCVAVIRYKVLNDKTVTLYPKTPYEIEIDPDGHDIREKYRDPVITFGRPLKVCVYDGDAVDLNNPTLEGDFSRAVARCEDALKGKGYDVFHHDWQ